MNGINNHDFCESFNYNNVINPSYNLAMMHMGFSENVKSDPWKQGPSKEIRKVNSMFSPEYKKEDVLQFQM